MKVQIKNYFALPPELNHPARVMVTLKAPVSDDTLQELDDLVQSFFQMADLGAYVSVQSLPTDAQFTVTNVQRQAAGFVWSCNTRAVDQRIGRVLYNCMVMFNQLYHEVESIGMEAIGPSVPAGRPLPELSTRSLAETYPPLSPYLRFRVNHELPEDSRGGARVEIGFVEPLSDHSLKQALDWLELWATVSLGAFAETEDDLATGECAIFDASPDITDDFTIEMPIEMFGAAEEAWNSLLNLCERINSDIARIANVTIE